MKICWDNLEKIYLTKNGFLNDNSHTLIEMDFCLVCGESYLTTKHKPSRFCSRVCSKNGKYAPNHGKVFSTTHRKNMSQSQLGRKHPPEVKKKLSAMTRLRRHSDKTKQSMSTTRCGSNNGNYRGGVDKLNIPLYTTYAYQISWREEVRRSPENPDYLQVKCAYCGKWFVPKTTDTKNRLRFLKGAKTSECGFYCSDGCKIACPVFNKQKYPKGFKKASSREVNPYLRQMCFKRDDWLCQICGKSVDEVQLHCHHIEGYAQNPVLGNDIDNVITLCKDCHEGVHKLPGCSYYGLRCENYGN